MITSVRVLSDKKVLVFTDTGKANRGCQRRLKNNQFVFGGNTYQLTPNGHTLVTGAGTRGNKNN